MKTIGKVIAILAVIHVLGVVGVVGWLGATDRLSRERVTSAAAAFKLTIAQEKAQKATAEVMEKHAEEQAAKVELVKNGAGAAPGAVAEKLSAEHQKAEIGLRQLERTREDIEALRRQLQLEQDRLQQEQEKLLADKLALETRIKQLDGKLDDAGMKRAVTLYESLPAKQAKQMFIDLLGQQRLDDVVTYLEAMEPRKAAAIIKEFKTPEEVVLAVKLTDQMRRHGKLPAKPGVPVAPAASPSASSTAGQMTEKFG